MRPSTVSQWLLTSPLSEKIEDVSLQEKMGEKGEVARGWGGKKVRVWGVGRKKVKKCNQSLSVMVPGTSFYLSSMPRNRAALNHKIPLGPSGMPFFFSYTQYPKLICECSSCIPASESYSHFDIWQLFALVIPRHILHGFLEWPLLLCFQCLS